MSVECTGRNVEVTAPLRGLAEERAARLERHVGEPADVRVILSREKRRYVAEVIAAHRNQHWTAKEENANLRGALTGAFEKIDAQALKSSERRRDRKHRGAGGSISPRVTGANGGEPARRRSSSPESPRVIRVGRRGATKPMTVEEAVMRIEASPENVFVFRDSGSEKISVLYKRRDGDFGLIVPEC
ncbi:MAG: ribosome-associated translation inhibitor RaiA [Acidobacteriota bacterium]